MNIVVNISHEVHDIILPSIFNGPMLIRACSCVGELTKTLNPDNKVYYYS